MAQPDWLQVGLPSLEHPFGVHLWPLFSKAWAMIMGYKAEQFRFTPGQTPISTLTETCVGLVLYYTIIFGGRELMKDRAPMKLNGLFKIHNFYLTAISGTLLALFIEQQLHKVVKHGVFYSVCAYEGGWTPELVTLYYVRLLAPHLQAPLY